MDTHKEEVLVLRLAGSKDAAVCHDNLYLDNMIKTGAPHTRHWSKTALPEQKSGQSERADEVEQIGSSAGLPYNGRMSTESNSWTDAMSEGPAARVM
jgi:hypothetical protein